MRAGGMGGLPHGGRTRPAPGAEPLGVWTGARRVDRGGAVASVNCWVAKPFQLFPEMCFVDSLWFSNTISGMRRSTRSPSL